jgi:hypothetical protein
MGVSPVVGAEGERGALRQDTIGAAPSQRGDIPKGRFVPAVLIAVALSHAPGVLAEDRQPARGTTSVTLGVVGSVQPEDSTYVSDPYLSSGLGGTAVGLELAVQQRMASGFLVALSASTAAD